MGLIEDGFDNMEPPIEVYPDRAAPVERSIKGGRQLIGLTWGMPAPIEYLKSPDVPDTGVTNVRKSLDRALAAMARCREALPCRSTPPSNNATIRTRAASR